MCARVGCGLAGQRDDYYSCSVGWNHSIGIQSRPGLKRKTVIELVLYRNNNEWILRSLKNK